MLRKKVNNTSISVILLNYNIICVKMHKLAYNRAKGPGVLFEALFNPSLAVVTKFKCRTIFTKHFNPFTPKSDQDRISPYNTDTISSRQVMRIEKNINYEIIS